MDERTMVAFAVGGTACANLCLELSKRGGKTCLMQCWNEERYSGQNGAEGPSGSVLSAAELSASIVDTAERYGGIDALIYQHCPGADPSNAGMLLDLDEKDWDDAMNGGARGLFLACKFILPYLISRPGSAIIVLEARRPAPSEMSLTEYVASRALDALLEHMPLELSQYGISIIRREIGDEREWMPDVLAELTALR